MWHKKNETERVCGFLVYYLYRCCGFAVSFKLPVDAFSKYFEDQRDQPPKRRKTHVDVCNGANYCGQTMEDDVVTIADGKARTKRTK